MSSLASCIAPLSSGFLEGSDGEICDLLWVGSSRLLSGLRINAATPVSPAHGEVETDASGAISWFL